MGWLKSWLVEDNEVLDGEIAVDDGGSEEGLVVGEFGVLGDEELSSSGHLTELGLGDGADTATEMVGFAHLDFHEEDFIFAIFILGS